MPQTITISLKELLFGATVTNNIVFLTIIGLSIYGVYRSSLEPSIIKHQCDKFNCTVNVVNNNCFARFVEFTNIDLVEVKCDKKRNGVYQIVLPCDSEQDGQPKINCDENNDYKDTITGLSICGILFTALILIFLNGAVCLSISNTSDSSDGNQTTATNSNQYGSQHVNDEENQNKEEISMNVVALNSERCESCDEKHHQNCYND